MALSGCGPEHVYRSVEIEIYGVSARAAAVTLKLFTQEKPSKCPKLSADMIDSSDAYLTLTWVRSDGAERNWSVPKILDETITVAVYTSDDADQTIQFTCREITYEGIGERDTDVLTITLSAREGL
jgi:hypothetical protein